MFLLVPVLVFAWFFYRWFKETKKISNREDKYVYITGCDSGFGNLLARHLDQQGFNVIAGCYTEQGEDQLRKSSSHRLTTLHLNVADSTSVSKAAETVQNLVREKGLWALVNNAGVSLPVGPTDWLTIEDYKSLMAVNLFGVIDVTISVLPLIKKVQGRVVNVASVLGRITTNGGPYCISKYGVESFNDGLRLNMAPFGVKVACIEPGFFKTNISDLGMVKRNFHRLWDRLPQNVKDDYGHSYLDQICANLNDKVEKHLDTDVMKVVHCMDHAITAVHPRKRYSAGWDAKFFWLPLSYAPTWISDRIFLRRCPKPEKAVL